MAARKVVVSEILYFLTNNINLLENEVFICNTADFYTNDDIVAASKILKSEFVNLKCEKIEKLLTNGTQKKDKLVDCIELLKNMVAANMLDKLPLFVSSNMSKIPNFEKCFQINFEILKNEVRDMLNKQHVNISAFIEKCSEEFAALKGKTNYVECNLKSIKNRNDCNNENLKLNTAANNDLMQKPILWSDAVKIPAEVNVLPLTDKIPVEVDASPFTVVNRPRKNQNKNIPEMKSDENIVNTETGKKKKSVKKIIGNKDSEDCKLKANKILIKKSFFSVSNVIKCHRDDVVEYLKSNDINVLLCYPVLKRSEMANDSTPDIENEHSTMFRVCVESCDSNKMKNPDIILKHIINQQSKSTSQSGEQASRI
ncbi:hypothetical protein HELRODRAFT_183625 [Helobdella robusta]|uniref:Uncharacterized protein n=1 Tax=Helobdella robusta TaxID=6412 RepID=T1FJY4_HELRO|nr:hypothetical protein HELRODRAFT_183625 [Helobdella robusta]ESO10468.1 hypothetical protein HELRODRAFT_183625 [Helobdella robusta]